MDQLFNISLKKVPDFVFEGSFFILCIIVVMAFLFTRNWVMLRKVVLGSMLVEYVFLVLCTTVLFRETQAEANYMLNPFWSYAAYLDGKKILLDEILLNVLLFIPIGLIVSSFGWFQKWWKVLLFGFALSSGIELMQYVLLRGLCEVDDVIHNTLGSIIGFTIYNRMMRLKQSLK